MWGEVKTIKALLFTLVILVVAVGYFRDSDDKDNVHDLDKLFEDKR